MVFCGMAIVLYVSGNIGITQGEYRAQVHRVSFDDFFGGECRYFTSYLAKSVCWKVVGSLLCPTQSRFDIAYLAIKLPTLMAIAGGDRDILVYLIKTDQIVYKILDSADWAVWYLPIEEVDMKKNGAQ